MDPSRVRSISKACGIVQQAHLPSFPFWIEKYKVALIQWPNQECSEVMRGQSYADGDVKDVEGLAALPRMWEIRIRR